MTRYTGMFRLHPIAGSSEDGFVITDKDIIKASVLNIIKTYKGSRVYDPGYGTNLHKLIFEQNIQRTRNVAKAEITEVIEKYEPRAKLISVEAYPGQPPASDEVVVVVKIEYVEFGEVEDLEIRMKKEEDWVNHQGIELDPVEEWFKNNNKQQP